MHVTDLSFSGYQDAAGLESPRWNRPVGIARLESQMTHNNNHIRFCNMIVKLSILTGWLIGHCGK